VENLNFECILRIRRQRKNTSGTYALRARAKPKRNSEEDSKKETESLEKGLKSQ